MNESLFSQSWYRVAPLTPRLRSHVQIVKHTYRGNDWYVIQDKFTGRYHRFSPEAYQIIGLMDGRRTLSRIWEKACTVLGDHMPTQDEVISLLSRLFHADLLQTSVVADFGDFEKRRLRSRKGKLLASLRSPLFVRVPLFDPDTFLDKTIGFVRPFLTVSSLLLWAVVVVTAIVTAVMHWTDLTHNISDHIFGLENLLLLSLIYPVVKIIHEFGHAYMVKNWGERCMKWGCCCLSLCPSPIWMQLRRWCFATNINACWWQVQVL